MYLRRKTLISGTPTHIRNEAKKVKFKVLVEKIKEARPKHPCYWLHNGFIII